MTPQICPQCEKCGLLKDEDIDLCVQCDARKINAMYGAAAVLTVMALCVIAYLLPDVLSLIF